MAKLTEEEKKQRALARKEEKRLAKQAAYNLRVEEQREHTMSLMSEKQQKVFLKNFQNWLDHKDVAKYSPFECSIFSQYNIYGKLSEKQIEVLFQRLDAVNKLKFEQEFFDDFKANENVSVKLKFLSLSEEFEQYRTYYGTNISTTVVRLVNDVNQHFKIKTNSSKIINLFNNEQKINKWFNISANVKYVSDNKQYVNLSSKGIKIEESVK